MHDRQSAHSYDFGMSDADEPPRPPLSHRVKWHIRRTGENLSPVRWARMWRYLRRTPQLDVIVVLPRLAPGGVERLALNLIESFRDRGIRATVLVTGLAEHSWTARLDGVADCIVLWDQIPPWRFRYFIRQFVVRSRARALLMTNSEPAYEATKGIKRRLPNVVVVDILHTMGRPEENDAFLRVRMPFREHIDVAVTVSSFLRQYMLDRGYESDPDRVRVIENAVPPSAGANRALARPGHLRVLWLGRVDRDKDPLAILDVAAALRHLEPDRTVSISVAGDGELFDALAQGASDTEPITVTLLGHVEDVSGLFECNDVLLNTSPREGQPLAVLEAISAGLSVVAYRVGGLPELAARSSQIHLVDPDRGPSGLAEALLAAPLPSAGELPASDAWEQHVADYLRVLGLAASAGTR